MGSLAGMVEEVRGRLLAYTSDRPQLATVVSFDGTALALRPAQGSGSIGASFLVEVGHELIQVTEWDRGSNSGIVPTWGRAQGGTTATEVNPGDKATINPPWPYWSVAQAISNGISAMYPDLHGVKTIGLTSTPYGERYDLPPDFAEVLDIRIEGYGVTQPERQITRWSVDPSNTPNGTRLYIPVVGVGGRPIYVTYRSIPTPPLSPADDDWTWESSGLPASAKDLPILHACATLVVAQEAGKLQNSSSEQSDRNRFVQGGSGNAVSRVFMEQFGRRLSDERRRIIDAHPPRLRRIFNR